MNAHKFCFLYFLNEEPITPKYKKTRKNYIYLNRNLKSSIYFNKKVI